MSMSDAEKARIARVADAASIVVRRVGRWLRFERENISEDNIETKQFGDYVTYADKTANKMLLDDLITLMPDSGIISEELAPVHGEGRWRWIVDPLDGTTNYLAGLPHWGISVALEDREGVVDGWGDLVLGIIYLPELDKMYLARQGNGAACNGKQIKVANRALKRSTFSHWWPMDRKETLVKFQNGVSKMLESVGAIRNIGSPAAELAMVAEGTLDGFWATDMDPWDLAAGILIVEEAGGVISDPWNTNPLDSGFPIAGNSKSAELIRKITNSDFPEVKVDPKSSDGLKIV
jgi:myo-inositol-1(or 4)-monophosphatase